jgi:hypothetical protein
MQQDSKPSYKDTREKQCAEKKNLLMENRSPLPSLSLDERIKRARPENPFNEVVIR